MDSNTPDFNSFDKIIVGVSGGKDSTALLIWCMEQGFNFEAFFTDTGWECPTTYEYLDYLEENLSVKITRIKPELSFVDLVLKKKIFPSRKIRYCTQLLKLKPLIKHYKLPNKKILMLNGERSEESRSRAGKEKFNFDDYLGCYIYRPLKDTTSQEVFDLAKKYNIEPNPLYKLSFRRVGCFPCIFIDRSTLLALMNHPFGLQRIEEIKALEFYLNIPFVILRRTYKDIQGIEDLCTWAISKQAFEEEKHELIYNQEIFAGCSSHYMICE